MRPLLAAALLLLPMTANAAGWSDFAGAFPAFPCQDGWMACLVGDDPVSPALERDSDGRPMPSDLRVGWDLEPTATFSPFATLSVYTGDLHPTPPPDDVVADVEDPDGDPGVADPPDEPIAKVDPPADPKLDPPADPKVDPVAKVDPPADPKLTTLADPKVDPKVDPQGTADPVAVVDPKVDPKVKPVDPNDPQGKTDPKSDPGTADNPGSVRPKADPPVTVAAKVDDATLCGPDNSKLEMTASMGKLSPEESACLERRFASGSLTDKNKVSRIEISNATGKGDTAEWERLVKRHLEEIDRSDPTIAYAYAQSLSKQKRYKEAIKYCDLALERREVWTGSTYVDRVSTLYKWKASAANEMWKKTSEAAASDPTQRESADKWRNDTKNYAREWYDYLKVAGKDTTAALQVCTSAAGSAEFCQGA